MTRVDVNGKIRSAMKDSSAKRALELGIMPRFDRMASAQVNGQIGLAVEDFRAVGAAKRDERR